MNNLNSVRVGAKLIMTDQWNTSIITVEKVYKNVVIANGYKFRKSSGLLVTSDKWSFACARPATEEDIIRFEKAAKRQKILSECRDIKFESLSDSQLEQILAISTLNS